MPSDQSATTQEPQRGRFDSSIADERMQVLNMLRDGKITAEEADQLLRALEEAQADEPSSKASDRPKWLRIRVTEGGVEKVNISIPLALVSLIPNTAMLQLKARGIDLEQLLQAGLIEAGRLIRIGDEGDTVVVYVE